MFRCQPSPMRPVQLTFVLPTTTYVPQDASFLFMWENKKGGGLCPASTPSPSVLLLEELKGDGRKVYMARNSAKSCRIRSAAQKQVWRDHRHGMIPIFGHWLSSSTKWFLPSVKFVLFFSRLPDNGKNFIADFLQEKYVSDCSYLYKRSNFTIMKYWYEEVKGRFYRLRCN